MRVGRLLVMAVLVSVPATAAELALLLAVPYDRSELATAATSSPSLRIARGEAEGLPIRLTGLVGPVSLATSEVAGLDVELARVGWVEVVRPRAGIRPDPLLPPQLDDVTGPELLWLRVSARAAEPGRYSISLVAAQGESNVGLDITVEVLPITVPATTKVVLQAAVAARPARPELALAVLRRLAPYRFNAFAGALTAGRARNTESYAEFLATVFGELGYVHARIPSTGMFSFRKGLAQVHGRGEAARTAWSERYRDYLEALRPVLDDPRFRGRLAAKLWDEPHERQYGQVGRLTAIARSIRPDLPIELTEVPSPRLTGAADIWVVPIKWLLGPDGARRPADAPMWLYANGLHGIDRPSHSLRLIGWLLWHHGLDGYHFWSIDWWRKDPWTTVSERSVDFVKRGTLLYPGPADEPFLGSLRLERFRDGIEDMLLVRILEERSPDDPLLGRLAARIDAISYDSLPRPPDPRAWRERVLDRLLEEQAP